MLVAETFYFFGDNDVVEWADLLDEYRQPPLHLPGHTAALSFGLAGAGTGVPFHFHGPGFAETAYGRKRWFLTHPDVKPEFHPNKTTLQWFFEDYERVRADADVLECTIRPGEVGVDVVSAGRRKRSKAMSFLFFPGHLLSRQVVARHLEHRHLRLYLYFSQSLKPRSNFHKVWEVCSAIIWDMRQSLFVSFFCDTSSSVFFFFLSHCWH